MVVPAEIIHVMHATSLRRYLRANARRIVIVALMKSGFQAHFKAQSYYLRKKNLRLTIQPKG